MPTEPSSTAGEPVVPAGRPPWWTVALAAVVFIVVTADVWAGGWVSRLDVQISGRVGAWGLRHRTFPSLALHPLVWFGQRGVILVVGFGVAGWIACRARTSEPVVRLVLALLAVAAVVYAGKYTVARPAPEQLAVGITRGASYPSGHLANAVLIWGLLDSLVRRWMAPAPVCRIIRVVRCIAPGAVLVGMSVLNYHWFSDFVGGAAAGVLLLAVVLLPQWTGLAQRLDRPLGLRRSGPDGDRRIGVPTSSASQPGGRATTSTSKPSRSAR